jgi:hypothetical protein
VRRTSDKPAMAITELPSNYRGLTRQLIGVTCAKGERRVISEYRNK